MGSTSPSPFSHATPPTLSRAPEAPDWAFGLVGGATASWRGGDDGIEVRSARKGGHRLVSIRVPGALEMTPDRFHAAVRRAYETLREEVHRTDTPHLVRVWNFIPGILESLGDLEHRYMRFNAARHDAYESWYGGPGAFDVRVATASGVGHDGDELLVHGLASESVGEPVENPRQVPSYRYSRRFGPVPPCFARATLARLGDGGARSLLVGGTASVRGEETVFVGDLDQQLTETFRNLDALVGVGLGRSGGGSGGDRVAHLARFHDLRIYHRRAGDRERVMEAAAAAFEGLETVELARADLCRDELLVEIEGVADLTP